MIKLPEGIFAIYEALLIHKNVFVIEEQDSPQIDSYFFNIRIFDDPTKYNPIIDDHTVICIYLSPIAQTIHSIYSVGYAACQ
jgi:hypothetical protein